MLIFSFILYLTEYVAEDESSTNGYQDMDAGTQYSVNQASIVNKKRKALVSGAEEGESDGEGDNKAPNRDIFRERQQKRVR